MTSRAGRGVAGQATLELLGMSALATLVFLMAALLATKAWQETRCRYQLFWKTHQALHSDATFETELPTVSDTQPFFTGDLQCGEKRLTLTLERL